MVPPKTIRGNLPIPLRYYVLADIYLTYAEAVFESTGSYNTIPAGLTMTAEQAVNKIRIRAGQPNVAATLPFYENNPLPGTYELASDPAFQIALPE